MLKVIGVEALRQGVFTKIGFKIVDIAGDSFTATYLDTINPAR
jgi:hypothetical protein